MPEYGLGRIAPPDRDKDELYLARRGIVLRDLIRAPKKRAWGFDENDHRDQIETSTCVEHAGYGVVMAQPFVPRRAVWAQFALYPKIVRVDEWAENDHEATAPPSGMLFGTSIRALMKVLVAEGFIAGYAWEFSRDPGSLWLRTKNALAAGTNWYSSMSAVDAEGFVRITPNAVLRGGHGYTWIGADETRGVDLWLQSWQRKWGVSRLAFTKPWLWKLLPPSLQRGPYFMTAAETTDRLIREDGELATPTEHRWRPQPA